MHPCRIRVSVLAWLIVAKQRVSSATVPPRGPSSYEVVQFFNEFQDDVQQWRKEMQEETNESLMELKQKLLQKRQEEQRKAVQKIRSRKQQALDPRDNEGQLNTQKEQLIEKEYTLENSIDVIDYELQESAVEGPIVEGTDGDDAMDDDSINSNNGATSQEKPKKAEKSYTVDDTITSISGGVKSKIRQKTKKKRKTTINKGQTLDDLVVVQDGCIDLMDGKDALEEAIHDENAITDKEWWGALRTGIALLILLVIMTFAMKAVEQSAGLN